MRPRDTTAAAEAAQREAYRRMSPERRVEIALAMSEDARRISAEGIRSRHPDYTAHEVHHALLRLVLGDDLYSRAWPGHALLAA